MATSNTARAQVHALACQAWGELIGAATALGGNAIVPEAWTENHHTPERRVMDLSRLAEDAYAMAETMYMVGQKWEVDHREKPLVVGGTVGIE